MFIFLVQVLGDIVCKLIETPCPWCFPYYISSVSIYYLSLFDHNSMNNIILIPRGSF